MKVPMECTNTIIRQDGILFVYDLFHFSTEKWFITLRCQYCDLCVCVCFFFVLSSSLFQLTY